MRASRRTDTSPAPATGATGGSPLLDIDADAFRACFDRRPFEIRHRLADHSLFSLPRIVELSKRLRAESVEYNAGDVPIGLDPARTPRTGLSVEDTIRRVEECRSWMVLKHVEQDPEYEALLRRCLDEVRVHSEPLDPGMCEREAHLFVTSPGSVTPFHIDHEHNFLLQVRGRKQVSQFDRTDRSILPEEAIEDFFDGAHRNIAYRDEYQARAWVYDLAPGDGLHFPITTPHWVKNGDEVSISFSITFKTPRALRRASIYRVNARLRRRGFHPAPPGAHPIRDSLKYAAFRTARGASRLVGGGKRKTEGGY